MKYIDKPHITSIPKVRGGKACIAGTGIRVQDVVNWYEKNRMSPARIVKGHPSLTLADVHAALAYYHDHHDEIRGQIKADHDFIEEYVRTHPEESLELFLKSRPPITPFPPVPFTPR